VLILAAMVNPVGGAPERESVLLLNASPQPIDVTGWRLADRAKASCALPSSRLEAGAVLTVPVTNGMALATRAARSCCSTRPA